jgi:uncharacterized membrane protein
MSQGNPYQPPRAQVADVSDAAPLGAFVEGGQGVDAGRGWAWIASGFGLFRKRVGTWILLTLVLGIIVILTNLVPIIGGIAYMLLAPVLAGGLMLGCRELESDGEFGVRHLFAGFSHETGRLVAVGALTIAGSIAVMIPVFIIMGTSLFALSSGDPASIGAAGPGLVLGVLVSLALSIPLAMAIWFAPCLIVFNGVQPVAAFATSFRGCLKNIVPFLLYGVAFLIIFIVAAIPLGLGFLVAVPVLIASIYTAYRDIFYAPA